MKPLARVTRVVADALVGLSLALTAVAIVALVLQWRGTVRPGVDDDAAVAFALAAIGNGLAALGLRAWTRNVGWPTAVGERLAATSLATLVLIGSAAVPIWLCGPEGPGPSLLESAATLTGTGFGSIDDVDARFARPLLLWRGVAQWLGGLGFIAFGTLLRPRSEGDVGVALRSYAALSLCLVVALALSGLGPLDALVYGLGALSTGGLGTYDAGASAYGPAPRAILAVGAALAGIRPGLWWEVVRTRSTATLWSDADARAWLGFLAFGWILLLILGDPAPTSRALDAASTTGFVRSDNAGSATLLVYVALTAVGGCRGSAAGGIGPARCVLLLRAAVWAAVRVISPSRVAPLDPDEVIDAVGAVVAWGGLVAVATVLLSAVGGLSAGAALSVAAVTASSGGADAVGLDAQRLANLPAVGTVVLVGVMIVGRLGPLRALALLTLRRTP